MARPGTYPITIYLKNEGQLRQYKREAERRGKSESELGYGIIAPALGLDAPIFFDSAVMPDDQNRNGKKTREAA